MKKDLSVYIHVPFCARKCLYCDFLSFPMGEDSMEQYFGALSKEIKKAGEEYGDRLVRSVFFGGGTPSLPKASFLTESLKKLRDCFEFSDECEISLELNPGTASFEKMHEYRQAGFNRLSIGAQSLDDAELKRLGRIHDSESFFAAYEDAKKAGFTNINVDVMSALPGQSFESYKKTLEGVTALLPKHISAYSLIVEEGTPFYDMELDLPDEDEDRRMYHETKAFLAKKGYHRYEISNYALGEPGDETYECYHNKVYWTRGDYLGLGLGAASMADNVRWNNTGDFKAYLEGAGLENVEELDEKSCMEEFMFLGLRLVRGVSLMEFEEIFGKDMFSVYGDVIKKYENMGLLAVDDRLRLTEAGLDVSNTVMSEFLL